LSYVRPLLPILACLLLGGLSSGCETSSHSAGFTECTGTPVKVTRVGSLDEPNPVDVTGWTPVGGTTFSDLPIVILCR